MSNPFGQPATAPEQEHHANFFMEALWKYLENAIVENIGNNIARSMSNASDPYTVLNAISQTTQNLSSAFGVAYAFGDACTHQQYEEIFSRELTELKEKLRKVNLAAVRPGWQFQFVAEEIMPMLEAVRSKTAHHNRTTDLLQIRVPMAPGNREQYTDSIGNTKQEIQRIILNDLLPNIDSKIAVLGPLWEGSEITPSQSEYDRRSLDLIRNSENQLLKAVKMVKAYRQITVLCRRQREFELRSTHDVRGAMARQRSDLEKAVDELTELRLE